MSFCSTLLALAMLPAAPQDRPATAQDAASTPTIKTKIAAMHKGIRSAELKKTIHDLVGFGTRQVLSATDDEKRGTGAARKYLEAKMRSFIQGSGGRLTVERKEYNSPARRLRQDVKLVNIVATLKGTSDPERVYVVGGHYDSINSNPRDSKNDAPGANDDGSGTAVVVELCRVMSKRSFAATIKFVCYDGEEQGLLGSRAHAKALAEAEVKVDGMITNDIVGNTLGMDGKRRTNYLRCFSYSATGNDSTGRSLARAATYATNQHVDGFTLKMIYRGDRYGRGGDHKSFYQEGFPAIRITEPREDYSRQHRNVTERDGKPYGDLPEFVDFDYLARVAAVNLSLLAELASAPPAPWQAGVRGGRRDYSVNVSWPEVASADHYELVWRETTAADWQNALIVKEPMIRRGRLSATLKNVCLDDVVVGVRAVAKDGSRSRVTTPREPDRFNLRTGGRSNRGGQQRRQGGQQGGRRRRDR